MKNLIQIQKFPNPKDTFKWGALLGTYFLVPTQS